MKKHTKTLYTLTVALGLSTAMVGVARADADIEVKTYTPQPVVQPERLVAAPQPIYVQEEVKPVVAEKIKIEPQPVKVQPQPVYQPVPMVVPQPAPQPVPCVTAECAPEPVIEPAPCVTEECMPQPVIEPAPCVTDECMPQPVIEPVVISEGPCGGCTMESIKIPGPCNRCMVHQEEQKTIELRNIPYTPTIYDDIQRDCCMMAPLALDHVDFRIQNNGIDGPYTNRLGNYRFRIFGCRRFNKEARLNSGRIMERNIDFEKVFADAVDSCYKVLPAPRDLCLQSEPQETPEYLLTAEITDYFMNVCDEYDWKNAEQKNTRNGTSEITVTWRLMDLTKSTVYWKGESTGYGELYEGEENGENRLIERAFADAASNLRAMTGFEEQLMQRVPFEEVMAKRYEIIQEERAINPIKCGYKKQYECAQKCELGRPGADMAYCQSYCGCTAPSCQAQAMIVPPVQQAIVPLTQAVPAPVPAPSLDSCFDENGNIIENSACQVVDDSWIDTGDVTSLDTLCVTTSDPCKALTPENMYRLRSSVVQIEGSNGKKGAGLLISDRYILTSGDLVNNAQNSFTVRTVRNDEYGAQAIRVNLSKNTALLLLDRPTEYTPLALNLSLPEVGRNGYLTLGMLDVKDFKDGENYLENSAKIEGYRYTEDRGAEILANTFIQNVTVGGALFYKDCTVSGMAHSGIKTDDGLDVYIPTETALRSLGISICNHEYVEESPWQQTVYKPVTQQIQVIQAVPEVMPIEERK